MQEIPGVDMSILDSALTPLNLAMAVVSSVVSVAAGIFGFGGRSKKGAAISMGVYTAVLVASVVQLMASGMFTAFAAVDFILPVLYWWGLYQSE